MELDLDDEQRLIRETARDFAETELEPVAATLDAGAHGGTELAVAA